MRHTRTGRSPLVDAHGAGSQTLHPETFASAPAVRISDEARAFVDFGPSPKRTPVCLSVLLHSESVQRAASYLPFLLFAWTLRHGVSEEVASLQIVALKRVRPQLCSKTVHVGLQTTSGVHEQTRITCDAIEQRRTESFDHENQIPCPETTIERCVTRD